MQLFPARRVRVVEPQLAAGGDAAASAIDLQARC